MLGPYLIENNIKDFLSRKFLIDLFFNYLCDKLGALAIGHYS